MQIKLEQIVEVTNIQQAIDIKHKIEILLKQHQPATNHYMYPVINRESDKTMKEACDDNMYIYDGDNHTDED